MQIILYKVSDENNKIDKMLSSGCSMTGSLKEESNVLRPTILINIDNPTSYNYMYIDDFKRYYYIKEMTSIRTGLWRLTCEVDVLKTYASQIKSLRAVVEKQKDGDKTDLYINDGSFVTENKTFNSVVNFSSGFLNEPQYILVTAGA